MSSSKRLKASKMGVHISKETGGAYADVREVIESELARIREEWASKFGPNASTRIPDHETNGSVPRSE